MKLNKLFLSGIVFCAFTLASSILLAPVLGAQDGGRNNGPPASQVEVVAPLPMPVAVEGGTVSVSAADPLPVALQKKEIVRAEIDLPNQSADPFDATSIGWASMDGNFFREIPEGYALHITDIIVSSNDLFANPTVDEPFDLVFVHIRSDGKGRALDLGGIGLPYSHSFTTPLFFPQLNAEGGSLGITRLSDERLNVIITGYIEPVSSPAPAPTDTPVPPTPTNTPVSYGP